MALKSYVAEMFGNSPFHPLQVHMQKVHACVALLPDYVATLVRGDWEAATRLQAEIAAREDEADVLKKTLRLHLPRGLFMAVDRRDVLDVVSMQDKIANKAKDISGLMLGRRMEIPQALVELFMRFLKRSVDAVTQALTLVNELDELLDTGFRGVEVERVAALVRELEIIEADTDTIQVEVRSALRVLERDLPPVDVMFLYTIIEWIGDLGNRAQSVSSRLQVMVAK